MGGEEKGGMDWVEEEKSRMNRVKRRRLGWVGLRSWVEEKVGTNCVKGRRVGQIGLEEKGGMDWV